MRREKGFGDYRIQYIFPMPGVRESWRLAGAYTLTEQDIRAGLGRQHYADRVVALADHALDTHGRTEIKGGTLPGTAAAIWDSLRLHAPGGGG